MPDQPLSCVEPTAAQPEAAPQSEPLQQREAKMPTATVGKKAPEFSAMAFVDGGFKKISLSDYAGKWVLLCFYPGDFTFV
jgi:hypothetical protein